MSAAPDPVRGRLVALFLYAAAMGWLEAVVVVYIRDLLGMAHGAPPPPPGEVMSALGTVPWLVATEQGREAATIVMLAAVGWLAGTSFRSRFGAFVAAFGAWDIVYYLALRILVGWPPSLATRDLLFLIPPHPWWNQPVWVPVTIAAGMVAWGTWLFVNPGRLKAV